ncbi:Cysteine synthase B [Leminorella grimontii]|uniref:pyridoxal-phosphate dependent enzyme n=1 Tax=Leminorella grimontii TaxID=82981 RepID=UPI0010B62E13|nr:Cysteine synthase B [Leminorella grimontii]
MAQEGEGKILDQFNNDDNPYAHFSTTGPEIWRQTQGRVSHFVSSMGTNRAHHRRQPLSESQNEGVRVIGLQPAEGSSIPGIRRWSPGYLPGIFRAELVDEVLDISQTEAETTMKRLATREGIFCGVQLRRRGGWRTEDCGREPWRAYRHGDLRSRRSLSVDRRV